MLPTARRNIYFAKLTAILLLTLGLVGFQLTILPIEKLIYDGMIPQGLSEPKSLLEIIRYYPVFVVLIPNHFTDFLLFYGVGLTFVIMIFTAIMLERKLSYEGPPWRNRLFVPYCVYLVVTPIDMGESDQAVLVSYGTDSDRAYDDSDNRSAVLMAQFIFTP